MVVPEKRYRQGIKVKYAKLLVHKNHCSVHKGKAPGKSDSRFSHPRSFPISAGRGDAFLEPGKASNNS